MLSLGLPCCTDIQVVLLAVKMESSLLYSALWQSVAYLKRSMSPISILFLISDHHDRKDVAAT